MSYAIQCCTKCGKLEHGHTGPADRYVCVQCDDYPPSGARPKLPRVKKLDGRHVLIEEEDSWGRPTTRVARIERDV